MSLTMAGQRCPETNRLIVECYIEPGSPSYVVGYNPKTKAYWRISRAASGDYVIGPLDSADPEPVLLVCPIHGFYLTSAHMEPGCTTAARGYCRMCRKKYSLVRTPTASDQSGDVIHGPVQSPSEPPRKLPGAARALTGGG